MFLLVASVARQGKIFESRKKHITGWNVYPQCFAAPIVRRFGTNLEENVGANMVDPNWDRVFAKIYYFNCSL